MAGVEVAGIKRKTSTSLDEWNLVKQAKTITQGMTRIRKNDQYTDLTISCQGQEWKVHKVWICAQSEFFHNACKGSFIEAQESKINLDEDDPIVVHTFIDYLYEFAYTCDEQSEHHPPPTVFDVRVYAFADKYLIEQLKLYAARKFTENAQTSWADTEFAVAISEAYEGGLAEAGTLLQEGILQVAKIHAKDLLDTSKGYNSFLDVLGKTPQFGKDLSIALANSWIHGNINLCYCDTMFATEMCKEPLCPECKDPDEDISSRPVLEVKYLFG